MDIKCPPPKTPFLSILAYRLILICILAGTRAHASDFDELCRVQLTGKSVPRAALGPLGGSIAFEQGVGLVHGRSLVVVAGVGRIASLLLEAVADAKAGNLSSGESGG